MREEAPRISPELTSQVRPGYLCALGSLYLDGASHASRRSRKQEIGRSRGLRATSAALKQFARQITRPGQSLQTCWRLEV